MCDSNHLSFGRRERFLQTQSEGEGRHVIFTHPPQHPQVPGVWGRCYEGGLAHPGWSNFPGPGNWSWSMDDVHSFPAIIQTWHFWHCVISSNNRSRSWWSGLEHLDFFCTLWVFGWLVCPLIWGTQRHPQPPSWGAARAMQHCRHAHISPVPLNSLGQSSFWCWPVCQWCSIRENVLCSIGNPQDRLYYTPSGLVLFSVIKQLQCLLAQTTEVAFPPTLMTCPPSSHKWHDSPRRPKALHVS